MKVNVLTFCPSYHKDMAVKGLLEGDLEKYNHHIKRAAELITEFL